MEKDKNEGKGIQIPEFMVNQPRHNSYNRNSHYQSSSRENDFRNARRKSVDDKRVIRAKKAKRKHSGKDRIKRAVIAIGLAGLVSVGVKGAINVHQDNKMIDDYVAPIADVIDENTHPTLGSLIDKTQSWIDCSSVADNYTEMIHNGTDERYIAYVMKTKLTHNYEQDEVKKITQAALGADNLDTWAKSYGYDGINDPAFIKETEQSILRAAKAKEYQQSMDAMLNDGDSKDNSTTKGMGGK